MALLYFNKLFKGILIPLLIFSIIYIGVLAFYSIKNKNQENYIYNINFYLYILGILFITVFFSISLTSLIFMIKQTSNLYTNDLILITVILIVSFIILSILLYKFFILIKKQDHNFGISKNNKNNQKELQYMLNEIEFTEIKTNFKKKDSVTDKIEII